MYDHLAITNFQYLISDSNTPNLVYSTLQQQVEIYRQGEDVEVLNLPTELSGENILPGFSLSLSPYL